MVNNNQRFQGCCPLTPIPKPPKQRCICPPGPRGQRGPRGPQGEPGPGAIESAFRANKVASQAYNTPNVLATVTFTNEQFDLRNEYNGVATFIPIEDGVYQINAEVLFVPTNATTPYSFDMSIVVNDGMFNAAVAADIRTNITGRVQTSTSAVYGLTAGSLVTVLFRATTTGILTFVGGTRSSHFDAARFPFISPIA